MKSMKGSGTRFPIGTLELCRSNTNNSLGFIVTELLSESQTRSFWI